jgi:hypothetical protein
LTVLLAMGPIIMVKPLSLEVAEPVKDGMFNCQMSMVLTTFVATTFLMISRPLGVSMGKEPLRNGNSAISLDADPKNP